MRTPVKDKDTVYELMKRVKERGSYLTNFFAEGDKLQCWISLKLLVYEEIGSSVFLFRINQGFDNLYYISPGSLSLQRDLVLLNKQYHASIVVADVVTREQQDVAGSALESAGFAEYSTLIRMSRLSSEHPAAKPAERAQLVYADQSMAGEVGSLFKEYFDPFCEQVPLGVEIEDWIAKGQLICFREQYGEIEGFLVFNRAGKTALLRYWFVRPDRREKGVGSALINKYFEVCGDAERQIFWVIEGNHNAIKRYEHYGFRREQLFDHVFINQPLTYEGKDN